MTNFPASAVAVITGYRDAVAVLGPADAEVESIDRIWTVEECS